VLHYIIVSAARKTSRQWNGSALRRRSEGRPPRSCHECLSRDVFAGLTYAVAIQYNLMNPIRIPDVRSNLGRTRIHERTPGALSARHFQFDPILQPFCQALRYEVLRRGDFYPLMGK